MKKIFPSILIFFIVLTQITQVRHVAAEIDVVDDLEANSEELSIDESYEDSTQETSVEEDAQTDVEEVNLETDNNEIQEENEQEPISNDSDTDIATESDEVESGDFEIEEHQDTQESYNEEMIDEELSDMEDNESNLEENEVSEEIIEDTELIDKFNEIRVTPSSTMSVYTDKTLFVTNNAADDKFHLSLLFQGVPQMSDGSAYVTFKIPDKINLTKYTSLSANYVVNADVEVLGLLGLPILNSPRTFEYVYTNENIHVDDVHNTISLYYEEESQGLLEGLLSGLGKTIEELLSGAITLYRYNETHTFTLNMTLDAEAFSTDGTHQYTFEVSGTSVQNPVFTNTTDTAEYTIGINVPKIGNLTFTSIPDQLLFETTVIGSTNYVILLNSPDHVIDISDTRNSDNNWTLTAQSINPFTSVNTDTVPITLGIYDETIGFQTLNDQVLITSGSDIHSVNLNNLFGRDFVVAIDDPANLISNETYSTTIRWTLTDAP